MKNKLTILGCHSATPRAGAFPSAQVLEMRGRFFLIDCGEATQMRIREQKISFNKIKHIFISHLHGDHFYGLVGLISTLSLLNRAPDLHIYGPKGIKEIILLQLKLSKSYTKFQLFFHELTSDQPELIFEDEKLQVSTIPLEHRVYTNGFLFQEKTKERKLNMSAIDLESEIDICDYQNIKNGKDYIKEDGTIISNVELTFDPETPKSYAYCSDTAYKPEICSEIKKSTLLYHEATFLESEANLAEKTKHSTALQAAKIADQAEVGKLLLGHYSNRYPNTEVFEQEAKSIFKNSEAVHAGQTILF
ncbi:MAG: ribonuclease Z [Flavobacteriaceae bacterium]